MSIQKIKKLQQYAFVYLIIGIIIFIYFTNLKLIWIDRKPSSFLKIFYLIIFNFFAFMLFWSLLTTMFTDPGRVPLYWGYFLEDPEHKKRRYCLICHIFKPERTHHCSACNRCVLNMDHHCSWLNTCIGFSNRKYFMLLLFYVNITTWISLFGMIGEIINIIIAFKDLLMGNSIKNENWFKDFIIVIAFALDVTAIIVIGIFFKFHLELLFSNTTTIENLDKKRQNTYTNNNN
ncbi:hypothetical protein IMG5_070030, partial [Ichthyophthirius multifiliis]